VAERTPNPDWTLQTREKLLSIPGIKPLFLNHQTLRLLAMPIIVHLYSITSILEKLSSKFSKFL
jgi:hypothetical protein